MVVAHFLKWIYTAKVSERSAAASALARAFLDRDLPFEDRCAAEAALTLLLDDPSCKVRQAMAEALALSPHAPPQIIGALASDQPEVSRSVLALSPLLTDADLIERIEAGGRAVQETIAARPTVSAAVAAALAEVAEPDACMALLSNDGAVITTPSLIRIAERHGHRPSIREALIRIERLPSQCRHVLLVKLADALKGWGLVSTLMGEGRAERVLKDACVRAALTLIEAARPDEHQALVEHLRSRGELNAGFVVRTLAHGKVDFFGAVLVSLTSQSQDRVRGLLAQGQDVALAAIFRSAGISDVLHPVMIGALKVWREVAQGRRVAGVQEVSWLMLQQLAGHAAQRDLMGLLRSIHIEALRENARGHALAIAAA